MGDRAVPCIRLLKEYTGAAEEGGGDEEDEEEDGPGRLACAEATLSRQILELIIQAHLSGC